MTETILFIIEVFIAIYLTVGLFIAATHIKNLDVSDSRLLIEEMLIALFWPAWVVKTHFAGIVIVILGIILLSTLSIVY